MKRLLRNPWKVVGIAFAGVATFRVFFIAWEGALEDVNLVWGAWTFVLPVLGSLAVMVIVALSWPAGWGTRTKDGHRKR